MLSCTFLVFSISVSIAFLLRRLLLVFPPSSGVLVPVDFLVFPSLLLMFRQQGQPYEHGDIDPDGPWTLHWKQCCECQDPGAYCYPYGCKNTARLACEYPVQCLASL